MNKIRQTNSRDLLRFEDRLKALGWAYSESEPGIRQYSSPASSDHSWVSITICGRKLRTICSWDMQTTLKGIEEASIAMRVHSGQTITKI